MSRDRAATFLLFAIMDEGSDVPVKSVEPKLEIRISKLETSLN
jgi:hypothetical protein